METILLPHMWLLLKNNCAVVDRCSPRTFVHPAKCSATETKKKTKELVSGRMTPLPGQRKWSINIIATERKRYSDRTMKRISGQAWLDNTSGRRGGGSPVYIHGRTC